MQCNLVLSSEWLENVVGSSRCQGWRSIAGRVKVHVFCVGRGVRTGIGSVNVRVAAMSGAWFQKVFDARPGAGRIA